MTLPKPFYEADGITLYHGDAREILPLLSPITGDLLLTDPPYGIDLDTNYARFDSTGAQGREYAAVEGDAAPMDFGFLLGKFPLSVIWGANNWPQQLPFNPKRDGWICWDKRLVESADRLFGSPFELAAVLGRRCYEIIRLQHCGVKNADGDRAGRFHPTQKPIALMARVLSLLPSERVIDPFNGSGTTLRAAKDLNRRAIGVELNGDYCEITARRLSQRVLDFGGTP